MKKAARNALSRKRADRGMHIHEWHNYGTSVDGQFVYVRCTNRTRWECRECHHVPCICTMKINTQQWETMPTEVE